MKVKVCGMRDARNIAEIARLKPDYMGFVFYERSPRYAGSLEPGALDVLPPEIGRVGVFVDAPLERVLETAARYDLDMVQLHGSESPEMCSKLRRRYGVIKSFGIGDASDLERVAPYEGTCDYYLFDAKTPIHGGSGLRFDHGVLAAYEGATPYFLSGGLRAEDAAALAAFASPDTSASPPLPPPFAPGDGRCVGFDINSGFETAPGVKDPAQVEQFMKTIKNI